MNTIWKTIPGHEKYEASNDGKIRNKTTGHIMAQWSTYDGYLRTKVDGKNCRVNRLVAMAFLPNPSGLPQVAHIDDNRQNNNVENLMWISIKDNNNAPHRRMMVSQNPNSGRACPVAQIDPESGEVIAVYKSLRAAAAAVGTHATSIKCAVDGFCKTSGGYIWVKVDKDE